jgi:hypothetical protein
MDRVETPGPANEQPALAAIARMRWRIRLLRAARGAIELSIYGAAFAVLVLLAAKFGRFGEHTAKRLLWASIAIPVIGALVNALRRVPDLVAAQLLDRAYKLDDRLSNALEFAAIPSNERTPMMNAALADASDVVKGRDLRASRALAWHWPGETGFALGMVLVLVVVSLVEVRARVVIPHRAPPVVTRDPLLLDDDDIEAFREFARDMEQHANTDASRDAVNRLNQFIDQIADQRLDRQEAFRRLQQLQQDLERNSEEDRDALREALRDVGERMNGNEMTRQLSEALRRPDPQAAAQAMQQLAQQLRENRMNEQQRRDLQEALRRATERRDNQQLQQELQRAREEVERMLRQQRERNLSENEQRQLRQRQRDLERLNRDQQRNEQQRRQLQRLDRAMSQAMQDLMRDLAQAAQDLDQGAEDLNRMQNEQLSDQQMAELRQQLEDLRQRMRQQNGQGGQQQRMRLQRFSGQARGGVQPGGMQPGGRLGQLRLMRGSGGGGGMQIPGGQGQGGQQGQGQGDQPGNGVQAGTGHDEHIRGAATSIQARMRTVQVAGQQRGNGPSRSQIIRTAAADGFTSESYRDVHAEYWQHAQQVVHAGDVPPGYRSYVRRYFQLIRPRDGE